MSFNAFEVMRQSRTGRPPERAADPVPTMTIEEAVHKMDRLCCLVIASSLQRKNGAQKTHLHDSKNAGVMEEARDAALCCAKWERTGMQMSRSYNASNWKELIALTSSQEVEKFCSTSMMNPSILWRIILAEVVEVETL